MKNLFLKLILTIILINTNIGYCKNDERPNIVFILTDDQRANTIKKYMPTVYSEIFLKGTQFTNHFSTTPICGPSRVSIFTGLYSTEHGMLKNGTKEKSALNQYSIAKYLKNAGYYTGLVGKFHNTSNGDYSPNRKSEFDFWVSHRGGHANYNSLKVNQNGKFSNKNNFYVTEFWNRKAIEFIQKAKSQKRPFFLTLSHNAPHSPAIPDKAYAKRYTEREVPTVPSFLDISDTGKADWVNKKKLEYKTNKSMMNSKSKTIKKFASKQLATLMSVDHGVNMIIKKLKKLGLYENTILIFMSDNGLLWGEHCLQSKNNTYEEATRIPLAIAYKNGSSIFPITQISDVTANIDIAPTLADIAGISPKDYQVSGVSLLDIINENSERDGILIQGSWDKPDLNYSAYHTKQYVYSETGKDRYPELYDIQNDPYELKNLAFDMNYEEIKSELQAKLSETLILHDEKRCYSLGCNKRTFK